MGGSGMLLLIMSLDCYNDSFPIITVLIIFSYNYGIEIIIYRCARAEVRRCP